MSNKPVFLSIRDVAKQFDGLDSIIQSLTVEIQSASDDGDYGKASNAARILVAIVEVLEKQKALQMTGPIRVPDVEGLKPKISKYFKNLSEKPEMLKMLSAVSVEVNLNTLLMTSLYE